MLANAGEHLAFLAQALRLQHPRRERRVGADERGACQQRDVGAERQPAEESEQQRAAEVDRQRAERERSRRRACDTARSTTKRTTAPTPPMTTTPAHTATVIARTRTRRTSAVATWTASRPAAMLASGVADGQAVVVVLEHAEGLDLHRRERRQPAAQPGAQQRAPITRRRQALQQPRDEVAQQECARRC